MNSRSIFLLPFVLLLVFAAESYAAAHQSIAISSYSLELEADASLMKVHETIDVFFTATAPEISLSITPEYEGLSVVLDGSPITCSVDTSVTGAAKLTCPLGKETRKRFLTVEYDTSYSILSLKEDEVMIRHRYTPLVKADTFDISVILPSGYVVEDTSRFIVPEPNTIYSDGKRIIVGWERENLLESFGVSVVASPLERNSASMLYLIAGFALLGFLLAITWKLGLFSHRKHHRSEREESISPSDPETNNPLREIVYPDLLESEEKVVDALKANLGVLKQKDLVKITGFSKAKMSRLLRQMESRNIIKSKPYGNSRKIFLVTEKDRQQNATHTEKIETTKEQSISQPDDTTQPDTKL